MKYTKLFKGISCLFLLMAVAALAQVPVIRVACVGNSITNGVGGNQPYPQQLEDLLGTHYSVQNYGVSGRTMLKKGDFPYWTEITFTDAQNFKPHIIILCLGTNDSKPQNWIYKAEFYADYMDMIRVFREANPNVHIMACNPPPAFSAIYDINNTVIHDEMIPIIRQVRQAARTDSIDYYGLMLDKGTMFPDGVHPNNAGYTVMANIALNAINSSPAGYIRYFSAKPTSFEKDGKCILYWETTKNSNVTINGSAVNDADSLVVNPLGSTRYTLRTHATISDSLSLSLTYLPPGRIKSFYADPPILDEAGSDQSTLTWSTTNGSAVTLDGVPVDMNGTKNVAPKQTTTYTLTASGGETNTVKLTLAVLPAEQINRAMSRPVTASSTSGGSLPKWAVDGDTATAWLSGKAGSQSLYVDLGSIFDIKRVVLIWGKTYGVLYHLYALDALDQDYKKLRTETAGNGGVDDQTDLAQSGRWVRLACITKNDPDSAVVLKEIQVYGTKQSTGVAERPVQPSGTGFLLAQNYPNPFNPATCFDYRIPTSGRIRITIGNVRGQTIRTLVDAVQDAGQHQAMWDGKSDLGVLVETGVYFVRMEAEGWTSIRKILFLK
jgi:acyl-CoA thioesterase-1